MENKINYNVIERAVRWIVIMLFFEFILGTLLNTVINYEPHRHDFIEMIVLIAHIVFAIALIVGSFAHIVTSRSSHILGIKPLLGFLCIVGAFISGSIAADSGSAWSVLVMALLFGAALFTYGLSFLAVRIVNMHKADEVIKNTTK